MERATSSNKREYVKLDLCKDCASELMKLYDSLCEGDQNRVIKINLFADEFIFYKIVGRIIGYYKYNYKKEDAYLKAFYKLTLAYAAQEGILNIHKEKEYIEIHPFLISVVFKTKEKNVIHDGSIFKGYILAVDIIHEGELVYQKKYSYYVGRDNKFYIRKGRGRVYRHGIWIKDIKKENDFASRMAVICAKVVDILMDIHPIRKQIIMNAPFRLDIKENPSYCSIIIPYVSIEKHIDIE